MGEAANKKIDREDAQKRVAELRDEIVRKRERLSMELEELRRRRQDAIVTAKQGAKFAAGGAVGLMLVGSLTRAFIDLFREDEEVSTEPRVTMVQTPHEERNSVASIIITAITTLLVNEVRTYAMSYAREKLRSQLDRARDRLEGRRDSIPQQPGPRSNVA